MLEQEIVDLVAPRPGDVVVDGTFGAGGHASALARRMDGIGTFIAIDRDPGVASYVERFAQEYPNLDLQFRQGRASREMASLAREGVSAHVVILDLGVSSMQLDMLERGFSYAVDAPLDMRMDQSSAEPTAAELLGTLDERTIATILHRFGDERFARQIARGVVRRREAGAPVATSAQLVEVIREAIPAPARRRGGHPAKRTFQALRIAVNHELEEVSDALDAARELLAPGGRCGVISFQSLEDRIVKRRFAEWCTSCVCPPDLPTCGCDTVAVARPLTRRAVRPTQQELEHNPRSGSALLRAVQMAEVAA